MRLRLLRSILVIVGFWMVVGIGIFLFTTQNTISGWLPEEVRQSLDVANLNGLEIVNTQLSIMSSRFADVFLWISLGLAFSVSLVIILSFWLLFTVRYNRDGAQWKTLQVSMSDFPEPYRWTGDAVSVDVKNVEFKGYYKQLINELVGYAHAHKSWFIGEGHGDKGLFDHTLEVMERATSFPNAHPLLVIAAAAHDLGKVRTFSKNPDGNWIRLKAAHDAESAKILKSMPSWDLLPEPDRRALYLAVKFEHHVDAMPVSISGVKGDSLNSAHLLLRQLQEIDGLTSDDDAFEYVSENEEFISKKIIEGVRDFINSQSMKMDPDAMFSGVYTDGRYVFIVENRLREALIGSLGDKIAKTIGLEYRAMNSISKGTVHICEVLDEAGALQLELVVKSNDKYKLQLGWPLWDISISGNEVKGLICIDSQKIPGVRKLVPDTEFEVLGPRKRSKATVTSSRGQKKNGLQSQQFTVRNHAENNLSEEEKGNVTETEGSSNHEFGEKPSDLF